MKRKVIKLMEAVSGVYTTDNPTGETPELIKLRKKVSEINRISTIAEAAERKARAAGEIELADEILERINELHDAKAQAIKAINTAEMIAKGQAIEVSDEPEDTPEAGTKEKSEDEPKNPVNNKQKDEPEDNPEKGPERPDGPEGPQGPKGDPGPEVPQGKGPQGDPPPEGSEGDPGPEEPEGPEGDPGPEGPDGDPPPKNKQQKQKVIKNPFNQKEIGTHGPESMPQESEAEEPTAKDIAKMLSKLTGEARRGAIAGLNNILANRGNGQANESFTEAIDIKTISDEEFNSKINGLLDLINQIEKINYQEPEPELGTEEVINKIEREEQQAQLQRSQAAQALQAKEKEAQKFGPLAGKCQAIADKIAEMVKSQIAERDKYEVHSWSKFNRDAYARGVLRPGKDTRYDDEKEAVEIDIYFDRSGSWDDEGVYKAGEKIVGALSQYEDDGDVKLNIKYFANKLGTEDPKDTGALGTGTNAWQDIIADIKARVQECKANGSIGPNVILMTDKDMNGQAYWYGGTTVPGFVWFVFVGTSPKYTSSITKALQGKAGTQANYVSKS